MAEGNLGEMLGICQEQQISMGSTLPHPFQLCVCACDSPSLSLFAPHEMITIV